MLAERNVKRIFTFMKKTRDRTRLSVGFAMTLGRQQHPEDDGAPPTLLPQNYTEHLSSQLP